MGVAWAGAEQIWGLALFRGRMNRAYREMAIVREMLETGFKPPGVSIMIVSVRLREKAMDSNHLFSRIYGRIDAASLFGASFERSFEQP